MSVADYSRLSKREITLLEEFVAKHDGMTLEMLDKVIADDEKKQRDLKEKQRRLHDAEGIEVGIINECCRIPLEKRTPLERRITETQHAGQRLKEQCDIEDQMRAQLDELQACLTQWQQIRDIFVSAYPQATTSPRLSKAFLEASPRRHYEKSKSFSFPSPLASPRHTLTGSGKMSKQKST
jgi:hypothetical protein